MHTSLKPANVPRATFAQRNSNPVLPEPAAPIRLSQREMHEPVVIPVPELVSLSGEDVRQGAMVDAPLSAPHSVGSRNQSADVSGGVMAVVPFLEAESKGDRNGGRSEPTTTRASRPRVTPRGGMSGMQARQLPQTVRLPRAVVAMLDWKYCDWKGFAFEAPYEIRDLIIWLKAYAADGNRPRPTRGKIASGVVHSPPPAVPSKDDVERIFEHVADIEPRKLDAKWRASYKATHSALMVLYENLQDSGVLHRAPKYGPDGTPQEDVTSSDSD